VYCIAHDNVPYQTFIGLDFRRIAEVSGVQPTLRIASHAMPTLLSVSASVPRPIAFTFRPSCSLLVQFDFLPETVCTLIFFFFWTSVFKSYFKYNLAAVLDYRRRWNANCFFFANFYLLSAGTATCFAFLSVCPSLLLMASY